MSDLTWTNEVFIIVTPGEAMEKLSVTWPNEDLIEHDILSLTCPCIPDYKLRLFVHNTPGCMCMLSEVVHHSLDGRELFE
jgi:hypothetical protein